MVCFIPFTYNKNYTLQEVPNKCLPDPTDVLILGGGVIGLSIARELHKLGAKDITVVERGTCGREATWAAAGMLSPQAETDEVGPFFDLCERSRDMYPDFADALLEESGINIELDRTGTLYLSFGDDDREELLARYDWQRASGLEVERLSGADVHKLEPHLSNRVEFGLYFPNDWQVENRKLAIALRKFADLNRIRVVENTAAEKLLIENGRLVGALTSSGTIEAGTTVVATGAWTSFIKLGDMPTPVEIEPVRGQMVCVRADERLLRHVICTHRGYLVPRRDGRILSGSTSERVGFEATTTASGLRGLTDLATEILPAAKLRVSDSWAGLRPCSPDGLPVIGRINGLEGLIVATGHYRNGILLTPITAKVVAENIVNGVSDDVFSTFGPQRFSVAAGVA
jgi:glycine oxidase